MLQVFKKKLFCGFTDSLIFEGLSDEKIWQLVKTDPVTKKSFCAVCNKTFSRKMKTFEHIKSVYVKRKDVACLYCSEAFATVTLRNLHVYKVHGKHHKLSKLLQS